MDSQKEILPLRIVAARFISDNELEGLCELDRITTGAHQVVETKLLIWEVIFGALSLATFVTLLPGLGFMLFGVEGSELLAFVGLISFALWMATLVYWRYLQYGALRAVEPQMGLYANPDDPAVRNLERMFKELQLETNRSRAFYVTKYGSRRDIDERYFFGRLRAAFVSRDARVRSMLFSPTGWWFSREIFMEVDVADLIARTKVKPKRGPKTTYDYADAVMSLIEHPAIKAMENIRKHGNQTKIVSLLRDWYIARRIPRPSDGQLTLYASAIQDVIAKNRAAYS